MVQPRLANCDQVNPPVLPHAHARLRAGLEVDGRDGAGVQRAVVGDGKLGVNGPVDGVDKEEVEGAGEGGGGGDEVLVRGLGGAEGGDTGGGGPG